MPQWLQSKPAAAAAAAPTSQLQFDCQLLKIVYRNTTALIVPVYNDNQQLQQAS